MNRILKQLQRRFPSDGRLLAKFPSLSAPDARERTIIEHGEDVARAVKTMQRLPVGAWEFLIAEGLTPDHIHKVITACALIHDMGKASSIFQIFRRAIREHRLFGDNGNSAIPDKDRKEYWEKVFVRHEQFSQPFAVMLASVPEMHIPLVADRHLNKQFNELLIPLVVGGHHHMYRHADPMWNSIHLKNIQLVPDTLVFFSRNQDEIYDEGTNDITKPGNVWQVAGQVQAMIHLMLGIEVDFCELARAHSGAEVYDFCYKDIINKVKQLKNQVSNSRDFMTDYKWMRLTQIVKAFIALFRYCDGWASSTLTRAKKVKQLIRPSARNIDAHEVLRLLIKNGNARGSGDLVFHPFQETMLDPSVTDHLIVRPGCGKGKTVAALAAGFAGSSGRSRVALCLPTTTAANHLYGKWMTSENMFAIAGLRHNRSGVAVRDMMREIVKVGAAPWYRDVAGMGEELDDEEDQEGTITELTRNENFLAKRFIRPIMIMTLDQLCLQPFGSPYGCHLAEFNLPSTTIIVDELDSYSNFEQASLEYMMRVLHRARFMLLSATLSNVQIEFYRSILLNPRNEGSERGVRVIE